MIANVVFFFINSILNRIPSRRVRMAFYFLLSKGKISFSSTIGLHVRILNITKLWIGQNSNINFSCTLDGRGNGLKIGNNVDIAQESNIWTLEHNPQSPMHTCRSSQVVIEDNVWLANRCIVLPGTVLGKGCIVGAGTVVKGTFEPGSIITGEKCKVVGKREMEPTFKLGRIKPFR